MKMIWLEILFGIILVLIGLYIFKNKEKGWLGPILLLIGFATFLIIDGVGISATPKFNPELHDCTEFDGVNKNTLNCWKQHCDAFDEDWSCENECVVNNYKCVSWQPKNLTESAFNYSRNEKFCKDNPSGSECECVNMTSVPSFESGSVNYSNIIKVTYYGYDCHALIDEDSRYLLQNSRRKFASVIPLKAERSYNCNIPCDNSKDCHFETKCFAPLNLSLLKYEGMNEGFPSYCSTLEDTLRITANLTYEDPHATIKVERDVCVEAVPR